MKKPPEPELLPLLVLQDLRLVGVGSGLAVLETARA